MNKNQKKSFSARAFTSSVITFSFIGTVLTSLVLYISPHHYVADWFGWQVMGVELDLWEDLHLLLGFVFIGFGLYHIYLNWRPLVSYFKKKTGEKRGIRKESLSAIVFSAIVIIGTISETPPFSTVIDFADPIRKSFDSVDERSAVPHAEQVPLDVLARIIETDTENILKRLQAAGFSDVSVKYDLETLAEKYDQTPKELYQIIRNPDYH